MISNVLSEVWVLKGRNNPSSASRWTIDLNTEILWLCSQTLYINLLSDPSSIVSAF